MGIYNGPIMADDFGYNSDPDPVATADHAMRHWDFSEAGTVRIGSDTHKRMFCKQLLDTHNPYKPAVIEWPELSPEALHRVTSLPIWDIAVQTEGRAAIRVQTYADTISDPLVHEALQMDSGEEARHKVVLGKLVEAYGIKLAPEPDYPPPQRPLWAWMVTGYSECIDSFFAFGLFAAAKQSGYFPAALVDTFEPVIQEECRHILFFANWVAWYKRQLPWWKRPGFFCKRLAVWAFLMWERIGIARGLDDEGQMQDANFSVNSQQEMGIDLKLGSLLQLCLTENQRRMSGYDSRLLRPTTIPFFARWACRVIPGS
ncbi:MAG: hypothetical protein L0H29_02195 [Sinobacteraceae bacterium]|nr:hypothetical protein [Nevskiaceae bacterium]